MADALQISRLLEGYNSGQEDTSMGEIPVGLCQCGCGQVAPIAKMTRTALGHVKGQPVRYAVGHNGKKLPLRQRFEQYVYPDPNSGCFIWAGTENQGGYGLFGINNRMRRAHRVAWALAGKDPIPKGMDLCHKCNCRLCVNVEHLYIGTRLDNADQMARQDRGARGQFPFGVSRQSRTHGRFKAEVTVRKVRYHLGTFRSIDIAAAVAAEAKRRLRKGGSDG